MTDVMLVTIYTFLTVLIVVATAIFAVHRMHQTLSYNYYWISACVIGWLVVTLAYHLTENAWLAEYLDNLTFVFIAFLPVVLLQFVLFFYRDRRHISKKNLALLCIVPTLTTIIAVVPPLNWLLRSGYTMLQLDPLHTSQYHWSIWFYIHAGYSYILATICCIVVILQFKKQPKEYKIPSILMIISMGIVFFSDLPSFNMPVTIVDTTLVGACISMVALYFAIIKNPTVAFLTTARKALYDHMDLPVFIIDRQEKILDMNQTAHAMMETMGALPEETQSMNFGDITRIVSRCGGIVKEGYANDGLPHIFLNLNGENVVLKQMRRDLNDKRGKLLGSYVVMMDITGLRRTVDELQHKAEIDVLTGIPNRRAFERNIAELDLPENLPIAFIMGDVNRLKIVNDRFGHVCGDKLLKAIAHSLTSECPKRGFAARIGGDEFILVIPHCDVAEAQLVIDAIRTKVRSVEAQFMGASIALGCVAKTQPEQDIDTLIHEADQLMYSQKQYDRRAEGL